MKTFKVCKWTEQGQTDLHDVLWEYLHHTLQPVILVTTTSGPDSIRTPHLDVLKAWTSK